MYKPRHAVAVASNGLLWLAGMALSPFMANITLWGNASKLLAVAVGAVLSYLLMRFWIFGSGISRATWYCSVKKAEPPTE